MRTEFKIAASALMMTVWQPFEASALPFQYPNCQGKPPAVSPSPESALSGMDGGFHFSQDCSTLYVNPPATGTTTLTGMVVSANISSCPSVDNVNQELFEATEFAAELRRQAEGELAQGDRDAAASLVQVYVSLLEAVESLTATRTELTRPEGLQANMLLQLKWSDLVDEYTRLNSSNYSVQPLPLDGGFITYNDLTNAEAAILTEGAQAPTALEIEIPGLNLSELEDFNIIAPPQDNAVIFGNSLMGFVRMSLAGACPFYNVETGTVSPITEAGNPAGANLVANFTYFYRVGTEASYKLTFDAAAIGDIVLREVQSRNGNISAQVLSEEIFNIQQTETFKIDIFDPGNTLNTDQLRQGFMTRVRESFAHDLLSKFAEVTSVAELPVDQSGLELTGVEEETRTQRHCRRGGFLGLSQRCSNHVYTVKVPIDQVKERVRQIIADDFSVRYSEEGRQVSSILNHGSAGMVVTAE